jgi:lysophospholipid acyltransferase (LPLAT)-like uncharacterized protein
MATWRVRIDDPHKILTKETGPVIWGIWHNRLALSMSVWARVKKARSEAQLAAFISASKDGAFLSSILDKFGVSAVRGSTSRRGRQALLECTGLVEQGHDVAITPDGPRGPVYTIQDGIIALAQLTGRSIVPVYVSISSKVELKSWDRFQIPMPFSKCEIFLKEPIAIPRYLSIEERDRVRTLLRDRMLSPN